MRAVHNVLPFSAQSFASVFALESEKLTTQGLRNNGMLYVQTHASLAVIFLRNRGKDGACMQHGIRPDP